MPDFKQKYSIDDVEAIAETDLALCCVIDGAEIWIPQSQIDDDSEVFRNGDKGTLVISEWIGVQKGLL